MKQNVPPYPKAALPVVTYNSAVTETKGSGLDITVLGY